MNIANLAALLLKKRSLLIIILSILAITFFKVLHIGIGIDFTGDKLPDVNILKTPSYIGIDLDGDREPEYVLGELLETKTDEQI